MAEQFEFKPRENQPQWVLDHIRTYLDTNGEEGHIWRGVPTLLLTTTGRQTGEPYTTPLIYGKDEGQYIVVASRGGHPDHPEWYLNLVQNPEVTVQVAADRFTARARTAGPDEKGRYWPMMVEIWPDYENYQAKTEREIPVVILERA